jgi:hypothetical protein
VNFALSFLRIVILGGKLSKCLSQHRMFFSEHKIGWHLVYEDDSYSLY